MGIGDLDFSGFRSLSSRPIFFFFNIFTSRPIFMSPYVGRLKKKEFLYFTAKINMYFGKGCIWIVFKEGKNSIRRVDKGNKIQALIY